MKGQVLIEILVGIMVGVVILAAVSASTLSSLKNAEFSGSQNDASQRAQEGLELVRKIRNTTSLRTFSDNTYCFKSGTYDPEEPFLVYPDSDCEAQAPFRRQIVIASNAQCPTAPPPAAPVKEVTVKVSWIDSTCAGGDYCQTVSFVTCMAVNL